MKYSDQLADWLVELGYTHCFFVGGGNIMHLIESLSRKLVCSAVIHEGAAGIATEYFNEVNPQHKALALVTAGPGLTNMVTAFAGAFLESRELLVIGGQVKTADLARGAVRQRGIQEIDGIAIVRSVSVRAELIDHVLGGAEFAGLVLAGRHGRKGPVFLEIPLDIQGRQVEPAALGTLATAAPDLILASKEQLDAVIEGFRAAERPSILLGGGVSRATATDLAPALAALGCPVMTTWNGADRVAADQANYMGRPNTWGQRSSNMILQQSDFILAIGTRLGLQQTGFNWQGFAPVGAVAQVDIDPAELSKGHPKVRYPVLGDANDFLRRFLQAEVPDKPDWLEFAATLRAELPAVESVNTTRAGFVSPFELVTELSGWCRADDIIVPCSSGGAFTTMMQAFRQKAGQVMVTNKGLASMGYGLSGAIGAAFSAPGQRVVLVEGDGGFAQNLQEIGTAAINKLNLKVFIFDDSGYASIRMTQRNYFGGRYVGCDTSTGLGLPDWEKLFAAWDVPTLRISAALHETAGFETLFDAPGMCAFIVSIDPEQTYFPKIASRVTATGAMESNPLHLMSPELSDDLKIRFLKFVP